MSGVMRRCPACGTTQADPGECESCYEDKVRYFCDNHKPGRWLDSSQCNVCHAKFGDAPKGVPPLRPAPPRPVRPSPPRGHESRPPKPPRSRPPFSGVGSTPRPRTPEPVRPRFTLEEVLARMSPRERERAGYREEPMSVEDVIRVIRPEVKLPALPIKGCIFRFIIFIFLLIALGLGGLFLVVGGGLQEFVVDLGQSTGLVGGTPEQTRRGIDAYHRGDLARSNRPGGGWISGMRHAFTRQECRGKSVSQCCRGRAMAELRGC